MEEAAARGEGEFDESDIPEWKKGALVVSDQQEPEERKGFLRRGADKLKEKIA